MYMDHKETEIRLFQPEKGKFLRQQYPELNEFEEFRALKEYQLKFVWYFANPTSPIIDLKDRFDRAAEAVELSFEEGVPETVRTKYVSCKFNSEVNDAIKVMRGFNPDYRLRAKFTVAHAFGNIEKILHLTDEEKRLMDIGKMKQYSEMAIKIISELPDMISIMERGFGIVDIPKKKKEESRNKEEAISPMEDKIKTLDQPQN